MVIGLPVREVEEILESREDLQVQAVIHPAVKTEVEEGNRAVDREVDLGRGVGRKSRKGLPAEEQEDNHLQAILPHAPEVEIEADLQAEVVQDEEEKNRTHEAEKDQTEDLKRVDQEALVENVKNLQIHQIDQGRFR